MNLLSKSLWGIAVLSLITLSGTDAQAFCGVIQKSGTAKSAGKAQSRAQREVSWELRKLRKQYKRKLQLSEQSVACVGGAVAVDANGNEIVGNPSCTVTQPYCVNP
jgi:hypothetical protein